MIRRPQESTGWRSGALPSTWRRSPELRLVGIALIVFAGLVLSGPPRLRTRALDTALESPLSLDPAALLQVVTWLGAGGVVVYLLLQHQLRRSPLLSSIAHDPPLVWYLGFGMLGMASAGWSVAPLYTMWSAGKLLIGVMVVVLVIEHDLQARVDAAVRLLFAVYGIKFAALILLLVVHPALAFQAEFQDAGRVVPRLTGGTVLEDYGTSPMFFGLWLLTVAIFGSNKPRRMLALLGYGVTWVFLLLSQGRAGIMMGLIFLVIMVSLRRSARATALIAAAAATGLALTALWRQAEVVLRIATRSGEGFGSLSGRTDAFDFLIQRWRLSPVFGSGYGAGTRLALIDFINSSGLGIGSGHDVLSSTLMDLGVVGAAVLAVALLLTLRQLFWLAAHVGRFPDQRVTVAHLTCFMVWTIISCFLGQSLATVAPPFLVLIGTAWALRRALQARPRPSSPLRVRGGGYRAIALPIQGARGR